MVWLQAALLATAVSAPGETVLLDFYSDYCGPCRAMAPTIDALIEQGLPVKKVNTAQHPELARKYGVRLIPCYVMLVEGQEVDRVVGGTSFSRLKRMFELAAARRSQKSSSVLEPPAHGARPPAAIPAVQSTPPLPTAVRQAAEASSATASRDSRPSGPTWTAPSAAAFDAGLIAASVRLRIEDPQGQSCGSGTIIDARQGEALILTCGHIFRDSQGRGRIEVDLFGPQGTQRVAGNLISYDLKRDVGLISIRTPGPVTTARVAPPGFQVAPGSPVVSVGCNNGGRPTARHSRVTSLNKFLPPPNLQVAGMPVEGRSGGGLFSDAGLVIGVCNAADPEDQEGLYAALASIHAELEQAGLSFVCQATEQGPASQAIRQPPGAAVAEIDPPPAMPKQMPSASGPAKSARQPTEERIASTAPLAAEEQSALDEIRRRLREGAEVICVVRSRQDPQAKSEIIILDKVSPSFLKQLAAEARTQSPLLTTSLEIPRDRRPQAAPRQPVSPGASSRGASAPTASAAAPHGWRPSVVQRHVGG